MKNEEKSKKDEAIEIALLSDLADRFGADRLARFEKEKGKAAVQKYGEAQRLVRESADPAIPAIREAVREIASLSLTLKQLTDEQLFRVAREPSHLDRELALRELTFNRRSVSIRRIIETGSHEQGN